MGSEKRNDWELSTRMDCDLKSNISNEYILYDYYRFIQ